MLDVARRLVLVDLTGIDAQSPREVELRCTELAARVRAIQSLEIDVLICGALSQPLQNALLAAGVEVCAHHCGAVADVIAAYTARQLDAQAFRMPGCRTPHCPCRRRRRRSCRAAIRRENP